MRGDGNIFFVAAPSFYVRAMWAGQKYAIFGTWELSWDRFISRRFGS